MKREQFYAATQPVLTNQLLAAYVARQQALKSFDGFDVEAHQTQLTEASAARATSRTGATGRSMPSRPSTCTARPALNPAVLATYAEKNFVPTVQEGEAGRGREALPHPGDLSRGARRSDEGQLAVANVIINRALSKKYPSSICGVVFQNADKGRYKCQFTFACDGRSDIGTGTRRLEPLGEDGRDAFYEFQQGERPGVLPNSALFYHTTQ